MAAASTASSGLPRLVDIGSNLGDPVFRGNYHGKQAHSDDFDDILKRAQRAGVGMQLLTGDCLEGSKEVLELAQKHRGLFATIGCHPCRATEPDAHPGGFDAYFEALDELIAAHKGSKSRALAVGECGLDYDRLHLAPKEAQLRGFPPQLELASKHNLPLFLHSRACHPDFVALLKAHGKPLRGVVHSHSGTAEEALELISMGFYIGLNGCSLKTAENLEGVKRLPLDRLLIESDCPWCEIRPSHASHALLADLSADPANQHLKERYLPVQVKKEKWAQGKAVKGRNEPCGTGQVAWVVAKLKGVSIDEVARVTTSNFLELFKGEVEMDDGVWEDGLEQGHGDAQEAESSGP
ncbi:3'-5'-exodeoxyribonuclease [Rhodotorula paludigena]|uniref:3'-5'-exodeoxyribonuclease n=1 Tax=Rhodotorula paludigena TaxID=86838 RepID=UPI00317F82D2